MSLSSVSPMHSLHPNEVFFRYQIFSAVSSLDGLKKMILIYIVWQETTSIFQTHWHQSYVVHYRAQSYEDPALTEENINVVFCCCVSET